MTALAQRLAELSPEKRAMLEARLKTPKPGVVDTIPALPRDGRTFPASFAQQRVWFLEQLAPGAALYTIPAALRLRGPLDAGALAQALTALVARHEALRTTFQLEDGQPVQCIQPPCPVPLAVISIADRASEAHEREVQQYIRAHADQPFDLASGPLLRAQLLQSAPDEHILLLALHHLVADGWSIDLLLREVALFYAAARRGRVATLPPLPVQYADVAVWQRQWLSGARLEQQLDYWRAHLAGAPALLELPTDRPRPLAQGYRGASEDLLLPPALIRGVEQLSRQAGVTLFMALLSAYVIMLQRYSGQHDLVVGTPIANRTRREQEGLIGFFANTLALRVQLDPGATVRDTLATVKTVALDAYGRQGVPFELVVDALHVERALSYAPIFQAAFSLREDPLSNSFNFEDLQITPLETSSSIAKFDLMLTVTTNASGRMCASLEYNTDLFDAATVRRMLSHYQAVLAAMVADPSRPIATLPILSADERRQLLVDFTATRRPYPHDQTVAQLFEAQVARTPDALAIVAGDSRLTYAQLNAQANQLARWLRGHGVGRNTLVGVCLERTPQLIVALLAILKAGGAYLPLDPNYPAERVQFMLADTAAPLLLTQTGLAAHLPQGTAEIAYLDQIGPQLATMPANNLSGDTLAEDLAYIIYTSGSTGTPKGAMIPQRAINRLVINTNYIDIQPDDVIAQASTAAFDAATFEIWGALLNGATLALMTRDILLSPYEFAEQLEVYGITTIFLTTALFNQLARTIPGVFQRLRHVLFGGEPTDTARVRDVLRNGPPARLVNVYGPTETTTFATWYEISALPEEGATVPIGRPLANDQTYVLDAHLQPVPIGVIGELYIGGAGVGLGYLNRPELTAEKFVTNPFAKIEDRGWKIEDSESSTARSSILYPLSSRLYRTGDLARYLADGAIEYVGRADQQVKIRGFRIELGEIESALAKHPDIQEVCVVAREDAPGDKRLVAYIVPAVEDRRSKIEDRDAGAHGQLSSILYSLSSDLRAFLKQHLPGYMIPSAFVALPALPVTPNGKIDRRALPAPDMQPEERTAYIAPHTLAERQLAAIWERTLGVSPISIHDNFFALGGDSIQSIQVISRAREVGIILSPRQIIQAQTLADLAAQVASTCAVEAEQGLVTGAVPLTPIQQWFFAQQHPNPHHFNQSMLLEVRRPLDPAVLEASVQQLIRHHDALRNRFTLTEEGWAQAIAAEETNRICHTVDLSQIPTERLADAITAAAAEAQRSLNISDGPIFRVLYINCGEERAGRLLLIGHHLVVDGVSWRVLLEDFQAAYSQLAQGAGVQLPRKTTSFQQWSQRLNEYAHLAELGADAGYWRALTTSMPPLPRDTPNGSNTAGSTHAVTLSLTVAETTALLRDVPAAYHTQINDVLLTALVRTCAPWADTGEPLIAVEGHGRELIADDLDVSRTVGWFTSMFPIQLAFEPDRDDGQALRATSQLLRRIPRNGLSYGLLRYLSDDPQMRAELTRLPQAAISFNYLGQFEIDSSQSAIFAPANESPGPEQDPDTIRPYLLDVVSSVISGQLQVDWLYSTNLYHKDTVAALAEAYIENLRELIQHCCSVARESAPAMDERVEEPSLLIALNGMGSRPPFFCVHPSDGTVYCFVDLARALGPDQPFYAFQAQGLDDGAAPYTSLPEMAACYVRQIRSVQPRGPYRIGGWSMGGVVAFEMACQLVAQGEEVALLAIFDAGTDLTERQRTLVRQMVDVAATMPTQFSYEGVQQLELGDQLEFLVADAGAAGVSLDLDQLTGTIMKVLSAHGQARIAYTPEAYSGTVTLFCAEDQSFVAGGAPLPQTEDPTMGWGALAAGGVVAHQVPGDHLTMLRRPHVTRLAAALANALEADLHSKKQSMRGTV